MCSEMNRENLEKQSFSKERRGLVPNLRSCGKLHKSRKTTGSRKRTLKRRRPVHCQCQRASRCSLRESSGGKACSLLGQGRPQETCSLTGRSEQVCFSSSILRRRCHEHYNSTLKFSLGITFWPLGLFTFPFYCTGQMICMIFLFSVWAMTLSEVRAKQNLLQREYTFFPFLREQQRLFRASTMLQNMAVT